MKKIVFILLVALAFVSCSKDESDIIPTDGQYVACTEYSSEHSSTFCLIIENGRCTDFMVYSDVERFNYYKPAAIRTNGSYPKYTYRINDFTVQARFSDLENFTANLSGVLYTHKDDALEIGEVHGVITFEAKGVQFVLDNTPLDANGDGILDSKQWCKFSANKF